MWKGGQGVQQGESDALASLMAPPARRQSYHFTESGKYNPLAAPAAPPSIANELSSQVEAMKKGLTPKHTGPIPVPEEVALAIEMANAARRSKGKERAGSGTGARSRESPFYSGDEFA